MTRVHDPTELSVPMWLTAWDALADGSAAWTPKPCGNVEVSMSATHADGIGSWCLMTLNEFVDWYLTLSSQYDRSRVSACELQLDKFGRTWPDAFDQVVRTHARRRAAAAVAPDWLCAQ